MIGFILIALIAALHVYIMVLEMALWETPRAMKAFGTTREFAAQSKVLAANQGLYNGFLVAGLVWALVAGVPGEGRALALFFLGCVLVAGGYGAATVHRRILFIQAIPAGLAITVVWMGW